jgi:malonate-semialdehyde dehydrogenase (acetylating)/methylmalonate-semialdehyde dehydrogenase
MADTDTATVTSAPDTAAPRVLRNHVAGAWQEVEAVETLTDLDPATGAVLAEVPLSGTAATAAAAAKAAQREWREVPPQVRARHLMKFREALDAHRGELAALVTQDMGKTTDDALGEVGRGIENGTDAVDFYTRKKVVTSRW